MKHLSEATIQSLLDGELTDDAASRATDHLAVCEFCTNAFVEAEAAQTEVNLAFAAETAVAATACPSQRIWARIENEIDFLAAPHRAPVKAESKSFWQQVGVFWTPAQTAFAAGLAVAVFAAFFAIQALRQTESTPVQTIAETTKSQNVNPNSPIPVAENPVAIAPAKISNAPNDKPQIVKAVYHPKPAALPVAKDKGQRTMDVFKPLPEEHNYLNSIAELSKAVQTSDEFVMRPAFRVEYERNLAVMDKAIEAMQKQVRQNPRDENARRILFASYQNKIELLNTVAEKSQMIASLR